MDGAESPEAAMRRAGVISVRPRLKIASKDGPASALEKLIPIDPRQWTQPAPDREWIVPEWLPRGVVTGLYGDGGVGKSLLAMQLLACTAMSLPWLGLDVTGARALGVFCEDDADELQRRQEAINRALGIEMASLDNLRLLSRTGDENSLISFDGQDIGMKTDFRDQLEELISDYKPGLVVLDTAADLFPASENDRAKVRQFVGGVLGRLARVHHCAILLCAHPSLTGMSSGTGASGSTAWNNTMRSRWYLTRPDQEGASANARVLTRVKANYAPREATINLDWHHGAFRLADAASSTGADIQWPTIEALFDELEKAWNEGRAWSYRAETRAAGRYFPKWAQQQHGVPAARVKELLSDWLMNGYLAFEVFDTNRKSRGLRVLRRLLP